MAVADRNGLAVLYLRRNRYASRNKIGRSRPDPDGDSRRYRRRWKIERLFARLQKPPQSSSPIGRYAENFASKLDATAIFLQ